MLDTLKRSQYVFNVLNTTTKMLIEITGLNSVNLSSMVSAKWRVHKLYLKQSNYDNSAGTWCDYPQAKCIQNYGHYWIFLSHLNVCNAFYLLSHGKLSFYEQFICFVSEALHTVA